MAGFGINWSVKTAMKTQSLLFDFSKISPNGAPITQGTVLRTGIKFSPGLFVFIAKQGIIDVTANNAATFIRFQIGATVISTLLNVNFVGNQYLVLASNIIAGELTINILGGAGDITAGKFIYSFNYLEQLVS
jgi:hypothetical protein